MVVELSKGHVIQITREYALRVKKERHRVRKVAQVDINNYLRDTLIINITLRSREIISPRGVY